MTHAAPMVAPPVRTSSPRRRQRSVRSSKMGNVPPDRRSEHPDDRRSAYSLPPEATTKPGRPASETYPPNGPPSRARHTLLTSAPTRGSLFASNGASGALAHPATTPVDISATSATFHMDGSLIARESLAASSNKIERPLAFRALDGLGISRGGNKRRKDCAGVWA